MKNLKLNKLNRISDELKNAVRGGDCYICHCSCYYEGQPGGSTTASNGKANAKLGIDSPVGVWKVAYEYCF